MYLTVIRILRPILFVLLLLPFCANQAYTADEPDKTVYSDYKFTVTTKSDGKKKITTYSFANRPLRVEITEIKVGESLNVHTRGYYRKKLLFTIAEPHKDHPRSITYEGISGLTMEAWTDRQNKEGKGAFLLVWNRGAGPQDFHKRTLVALKKQGLLWVPLSKEEFASNLKDQKIERIDNKDGDRKPVP